MSIYRITFRVSSVTIKTELVSDFLCTEDKYYSISYALPRVTNSLDMTGKKMTLCNVLMY